MTVLSSADYLLFSLGKINCLNFEACMWNAHLTDITLQQRVVLHEKLTIQYPKKGYKEKLGQSVVNQHFPKLDLVCYDKVFN